MYLFFDTETNGLPKNYNGSAKDFDNWPRVIQLAFVLLDENFNEIETFCELIKPDGWIIPKEKFWIENGYKTETNEKNGIPMFDALVRFCHAIDRSTTLVAHNISFDHPVMSAEMIRFKIGPNKKPENKICTMKQSVNFCRIPNKNNSGFKWPKLNELHFKLFGCGFENSHDALADVHATIRCFVELKRLKVL